jgi:phosphate:Na+ symporter
MSMFTGHRGTRLTRLAVACFLFTVVGAQAASAMASGQTQIVDFSKMGMAALAGLVLFIYGLSQLAEGLGKVNTERMRDLLAKFTTNRFAAVGTGIVATALLESSSVTIIMVIALVSSGILTFVQSLGVVLGANIGTAVGAQVIALNIKHYTPLLMFAGMVLSLAFKHETVRNVGVILLGFGLMFFGLDAIEGAVRPLRKYQPFIDLMETLGNRPLFGALIGAAVTVVIQSSSATVAIVITLASSGMISLPAGVAIVLGAEIGTCSDTLLATIGRGRSALRTGVFHLLFNLTTAGLAILFAPQLVQLVLAVSGGAGIGRQIANAQIFFNIIGVTAAVLFLPAIARGLHRLIPDREPAAVTGPATYVA